MPFHKGSNHSVEFAGPTCPSHGVCCFYTEHLTPIGWYCPINGCTFTDTSTPPPKKHVGVSYHLHIYKTGWVCSICGYEPPPNLVNKMNGQENLTLADMRGDSPYSNR